MYGNRVKAITHKSNILDTIYRLQREYGRFHCNIPNVVYMNYETFKFLEHECHVRKHRIYKGSNDNNYIFDMKIEIDNRMSNFEILVEREGIINMRDHDLDVMRYLRADFCSINQLGDRNANIRKPKRYIINKGATILFWEDGTKTIVKRSKDDAYNKRLGFLTAYFQKHSGLSKNQANKYLANLQDEEELANVK